MVSNHPAPRRVVTTTDARPSLAALMPREHGSWALALEPMVLALLAAPSWHGVSLAVAALALFLMRRPSQVVRTGRDPLLVRQAWIVLGVLGSSALMLASVAVAAHATRVAVPLAIAALTGITFAWLDSRRKARGVVAELAGACCFAALASAAVVCSGESPFGARSLVVGGFSLARATTSILALRVFLRRRKGDEVSAVGALTSAVAFSLVAVASVRALESWILVAWCLAFLLRTTWLLGPRPPGWPARRLGMMELALGLAAMISTGIALQ